jgi:predicted nicotinamide N-methyase
MQSATAGAERMLNIDGVPIRLWHAIGLERYVDREALLRADPVPEPPYWMHVWPGAMAAARLLSQAPIRPGARVIELGCGLGLPALVAARRGASVVAVDRLGEPLAFLRRSAALNDLRVSAVQMDWRAPALATGVPICVGADVAYDAEQEDALAAAAGALVARRGVLWLADSVNTARTGLAARLRALGFAVDVRQVRESEDGRPVWVRIIEARR